MLDLNARLRFYFREHLKSVQKCGEKDAFYNALNDPLDSTIEGCT